MNVTVQSKFWYPFVRLHLFGALNVYSLIVLYSAPPLVTYLYTISNDLTLTMTPKESQGEIVPLALNQDVDDPHRAAHFHTYEHAHESLDYELCDNTVYKAQEANTNPADPLLYRATKYFICAFLGLCVAGAAFFVNIGVENIAGLKFWLMFQASRYSYFLGWLIMTAMQVGLSVMAACVCIFFAPAAQGSGIPEVIAYLNGIDVYAVFLFKTLVAKIVGSLGSVGGGLAIGKEGPFVHIGACLALLLSQGGTWAQASGFKWLATFKNDRDRRDFVTCGAAAGVAAAFRAPVGGVLFALEELSSHWSKQLLLMCFFTTAMVNVITRMVMSVCKSGNCGFFGEGNLIIFQIAEEDAQKVYETFELLPMLLVGIVGGLLGALFNFLNEILTVWRKQHVTRRRQKLWDVAAVAVLSATLSFLLPLTVPCRDCPIDVPECPRAENSHSGNFVAFGCERPDQYNDLATLFYNTQDDAIRNLFSARTPQEYSTWSLFVFFLVFYALTIITYGIAVPAGLFVPSVLMGACYGRMVGSFVRRLHPHSGVDESTYALLGSASYMAGSMRLVVSVCVMLLELTNQLSLLPLMMLVLVVARAVGDGSGVLGTYSIQTRLKSFPMMDPSPEKPLRHVTAQDLCAHSPPVTLPRMVRVDKLLRVLQSCKHNGFPVLDGQGGEMLAPDAPLGSDPGDAAVNEQQDVPVRLQGTILRHHLLVLLKSGRAFQHSPLLTPNSQRIAFMYKMMDFDKQVSTEPLAVEDIEPLLSPHVLRMYIDLKPYVNPASFAVQRSCCATQAYTLFQSLGLRHLCVIEDTSSVLGILTRKDFMARNVQTVISNRVEVETRVKRASGSSSNGGHHVSITDDIETSQRDPAYASKPTRVGSDGVDVKPAGVAEQRSASARPVAVRTKSRRLPLSDD